VKRPYLPEAFTPLSWHPLYRSLTRDERVRYNQLTGLLYNEHFQVFERDFFERLLAAIDDGHRLAHRADLRSSLEASHRDEIRHRGMFHCFAQRHAGELYRGRQLHFIDIGRTGRRVVGLLARRGVLVPFNLRLLTQIETYSCRLAERVLADGRDGLGERDEDYRTVHRLHLRDEMRHVDVDIDLIAFVDLARAPHWSVWEDAIVARLFRTLIAPRRATARIIARLAHEYPRLQPRRHDLLQAAYAGSRHPGWRAWHDGVAA
jgi:hypothetical protein